MGDAFKLLRIYTDEAAYVGDRRVFEVITSRARDAGLAGATVMEALLGYGRSAHVHRRHILENERALVIEIVEREGRLRAFAAGLQDIDDIGLMTLESVELLGGVGAGALAMAGEG